MYLTATPSNNTCKAMKILAFFQKRLVQSVIENRLGREWLMEVAFMQAGWVHQLRLYLYSVPEGDRFTGIWGKYINLFCKYGLLTICLDQAFTMNFSGILIPWVIMKKSQKVLAAHCTCMAEPYSKYDSTEWDKWYIVYYCSTQIM